MFRFDEELKAWVFDMDGQTFRLPSTWSGVIAQENQLTGDGRMILTNGLRWDLTENIPMRVVMSDVGAHDNAMMIGQITDIVRDGSDIVASGTFDLGSEAGRETARMVAMGLKPGVSIDMSEATFEIRIAKEILQEQVDEIAAMFEAWEAEDEQGEGKSIAESMQEELDSLPEDEDGRVTVFGPIEPDTELMVFSDARIRAATIVDTPAFSGALITAEWEQVGGAMVASGARPVHSTTVDTESEWDEEENFALLASDPEDAFAYVNGEELSVMHHVISSTGEIREANAAACLSGIELLNSGDSGLPAEAWKGVYDHLAAHLTDAEIEFPAPTFTFEDESESERISKELKEAKGDCGCNSFSLVAAAPRTVEDTGMFTNPDLPGPTPLTVSNQGRVFGHLALWSTCHIGMEGACVTPPHSAQQYAYFHTGVVSNGDLDIAVGQITLGGGHASMRANPSEATAHYDETGMAVADIIVGEDAHGIWFSGQIRDGITDAQIAELRASSLSGDWRSIGGNLELVAALAVNVPGFPIPRTQAHMVASGQQTALVASGIVEQVDPAMRALRTVEETVNAMLARKERFAAAQAKVEARIAEDRKKRYNEAMSRLSFS